MKNIEKGLKQAFIELLKTRRIDEIDVQLLSEQLKITRQSFYYHYKNVYDLVSSIVLDNQINVEEGESLKEIVSRILDKYYENEDFYKEILSSSAKDILEESTYSYFFRALNLYLKGEKKLNIDLRKDLASFISYGITKQMLLYFSYENYTKEDVYIKIHALLNEDTIKAIVEGYLNNIYN